MLAEMVRSHKTLSAILTGESFFALIKTVLLEEKIE